MNEPAQAAKKMKSSKNIVVIGGGIAGVCCAQELVRLSNDNNVILISSSDTLVESASVFTVTNHLDEIAVFEKKTDQFQFSNPNITIRRGFVVAIDFVAKEIKLEDGSIVDYAKLCICSGVRPKLIANHDLVLGLRDLNSLDILTRRLSTARRIAVVGNGGISLELIHELRHINVDWIVKDKYIGSVFFDASASAFILPSLMARAEGGGEPRHRPDVRLESSPSKGSSVYEGYGLGPEWVAKFGLMKSKDNQSGMNEDGTGSLTMHYDQQVLAISTDRGSTWQMLLEDIRESADVVSIDSPDSSLGDFPLWVKTTSGQMFGVDFIISATGVQPNTDFLRLSLSSTDFRPTLAADGCIIVNNLMESSIPGVFAAGDCCSFQGDIASDLYFQMKLWTQARSMGVYAAQCMCQSSDQYGLDSQFELFTHITRFFGFKVVMLGRYNAQGLDEVTQRMTKQMVVTSQGLVRNEWFTDCYGGTPSETKSDDVTAAAEVEFWLRVTPGEEYIKLVVLRGKVIGALLIGNTELEEVFENLILNRLDVSQLGVGLLDPDIDIADYFD